VPYLAQCVGKGVLNMTYATTILSASDLLESSSTIFAILLRKAFLPVNCFSAPGIPEEIYSDSEISDVFAWWREILNGDVEVYPE
jgi:hypothetical protein